VLKFSWTNAQLKPGSRPHTLYTNRCGLAPVCAFREFHQHDSLHGGAIPKNAHFWAGISVFSAETFAYISAKYHNAQCVKMCSLARKTYCKRNYLVLEPHRELNLPKKSPDLKSLSKLSGSIIHSQTLLRT
jgi:hypothetical protein